MAQPVHKVRVGPVSAAVWRNTAEVNGRKVAMLKASVERRYKDVAGGWRSSSSFSRNEVFLAINALQRAADFIIDKEAEQETAVEEEVVA